MTPPQSTIDKAISDAIQLASQKFREKTFTLSHTDLQSILQRMCDTITKLVREYYITYCWPDDSKSVADQLIALNRFLDGKTYVLHSALMPRIDLPYPSHAEPDECIYLDVNRAIIYGIANALPSIIAAEAVRGASVLDAPAEPSIAVTALGERLTKVESIDSVALPDSLRLASENAIVLTRKQFLESLSKKHRIASDGNAYIQATLTYMNAHLTTFVQDAYKAMRQYIVGSVAREILPFAYAHYTPFVILASVTPLVRAQVRAGIFALESTTAFSDISSSLPNRHLCVMSEYAKAAADAVTQVLMPLVALAQRDDQVFVDPPAVLASSAPAILETSSYPISYAAAHAIPFAQRMLYTKSLCINADFARAPELYPSKIVSQMNARITSIVQSAYEALFIGAVSGIKLFSIAHLARIQAFAFHKHPPFPNEYPPICARVAYETIVDTIANAIPTLAASAIRAINSPSSACAVRANPPSAALIVATDGLPRTAVADADAPDDDAPAAAPDDATPASSAPRLMGISSVVVTAQHNPQVVAPSAPDSGSEPNPKGSDEVMLPSGGSHYEYSPTYMRAVLEALVGPKVKVPPAIRVLPNTGDRIPLTAVQSRALTLQPLIVGRYPHWALLVIANGLLYYLDTENNAPPSSLGPLIKQNVPPQTLSNNCGASLSRLVRYFMTGQWFSDRISPWLDRDTVGYVPASPAQYVVVGEWWSYKFRVSVVFYGSRVSISGSRIHYPAATNAFAIPGERDPYSVQLSASWQSTYLYIGNAVIRVVDTGIAAFEAYQVPDLEHVLSLAIKVTHLCAIASLSPLVSVTTSLAVVGYTYYAEGLGAALFQGSIALGISGLTTGLALWSPTLALVCAPVIMVVRHAMMVVGASYLAAKIHNIYQDFDKLDCNQKSIDTYHHHYSWLYNVTEMSFFMDKMIETELRDLHCLGLAGSAHES